MSNKKSNNPINSRVAKGFGVSHPFADRGATNLGKSKVAEMIDSEKTPVKKEKSKEKVKISRAFSNDSASVEISESKFREIVKDTLRNRKKINEHEWLGLTWNHTHAFDDEWEELTGTKSVSDAVSKTTDWTDEKISDAGEAVDDFARGAVKSGRKLISWFDDNIDLDSGLQAGADPSSILKTLRWLNSFFESETASQVLDSNLIRSWERASNPMAWLFHKKNREDLVSAFEELDTRELGEPFGSDYFDDIDNPLTDSQDTTIFTLGDDRFIWSNKGRILSSDQLRVNSAEEAIDKFYIPKNVSLYGSKSSAEDFRGRKHEDANMTLQWGPTASPEGGPQYTWLARKLKEGGYNTKEKIYEILKNWEPVGNYTPKDEDYEKHVHKDGFVSPFWKSTETGAVLDEVEKIYKEIRRLESDPGAWIFKVYYCTREFELYRDIHDFLSNEGPWGTRWISDMLDFGVDEGWQDCYLVHYTDDPRFLTGPGRMVFRIQK